jgi:uncharacterized protein (DUF362 family)
LYFGCNPQDPVDFAIHLPELSEHHSPNYQAKQIKHFVGFDPEETKRHIHRSSLFWKVA